MSPSLAQRSRLAVERLRGTRNMGSGQSAWPACMYFTPVAMTRVCVVRMTKERRGNWSPEPRTRDQTHGRDARGTDQSNLAPSVDVERRFVAGCALPHRLRWVPMHLPCHKLPLFLSLLSGVSSSCSIATCFFYCYISANIQWDTYNHTLLVLAVTGSHLIHFSSLPLSLYPSPFITLVSSLIWLFKKG